MVNDLQRARYGPTAVLMEPKCQAFAQPRWLEGRQQRLLPAHYFHVVFTLPAELRELFRGERRLLCGLLMRVAGHTLLELGRDKRWLGAQLGLSAVLHTWSRDLRRCPRCGSSTMELRVAPVTRGSSITRSAAPSARAPPC